MWPSFGSSLLASESSYNLCFILRHQRGASNLIWLLHIHIVPAQPPHFTNQELDNVLVAGSILFSTEHSEKSFASSFSLILLVA